MSRRGEELAERLRQLSEDLADHAMDLLRQAVHAEEHERVALANEERRVTRARRALEKAADLLND